MKRTYSLIALVLTMAVLVSCNAKKEDSAEKTDEAKKEESNEWKEMDEFHMVMAETFHPYKDSSNLEPIKSKAPELYAAADKWTSSTLPSKVDNDDMKSKLEELKSETQSLQDLVKTGTDDQIGQQLTKVHDLFHKVQETWYGGGGHHH